MKHIHNARNSNPIVSIDYGDLAINTCLKISGFLNCNKHLAKLDPRTETLLRIAYEMEIKFEYQTERIN